MVKHLAGLMLKKVLPQGSLILGPDNIWSFILSYLHQWSIWKCKHNYWTFCRRYIKFQQKWISRNHDLTRISEWTYRRKMLFNPDPSKQAQELFFFFVINLRRRIIQILYLMISRYKIAPIKTPWCKQTHHLNSPL